MKNKIIVFVICLHTFFFMYGLNAKKAAGLTLKQTVEMTRVGSSKISPNGNHIAYTKVVPREVYQADDGKPYVELHVVDLNGNARPFVTGKIRLGAIHWGPNSQNIYFIAQRNGEKFVSIYRIPIDGGEAQRIVQAKSNIVNYAINRDASELIYLAKPIANAAKEKRIKKGFKAKVYEESVKNNEVYRVDLTHLKAPHEKLEIDEHLLSIDYSPVDNMLLVKATPSALIDDSYVASQFKIMDNQGDFKTSFKTKGKLGSAKWSPDGRYVAIIGAKDKNDPATGRLFIAESKTGKLTEPVKNYQGHVKGIQWHSNYQLDYLGHIGTKSEVNRLNLDNSTTKSIVSAGDEVITSIHSDAHGKNLIAVASSDSHPREVVHIVEGKVTPLTDTNPWLKEIDLPKQESIRYVARDGEMLEGVLIYPVNYRKRSRYPLIMMIHGGPESHISDAWLDRYSYPIKYAAANGYAVFLPNYRGSTGRGVEFSKMGQADYAGAEFNDLVDAIDHLVKKGIVDRKRVGITGGSYGGYASAWAATALSEHFAASVMFVGISDQLSKFGTTDIPKEMYNVHARNYPWDKWQWMLERSPIYHTDKAKTPILIMHGDSDTRVHPSQSMELYRYIKTRTKTPVRLVLYPGEGHGNRKTAAQLDYSMRLMRWMDFYLKGKKKGNKKPPYELPHDKYLGLQSKD